VRELLKRKVGVFHTRQGVQVCLWAPREDRVSIIWKDGKEEPLARDDEGYHSGFFENIAPDALYEFHLHGKDKVIPDPASRSQPYGVFAPSQIVPESFEWTDQDWRGLPYETRDIFRLARF
jgi:maltooligosyltrehalose trehalohydrolase